MIKEIRFQNFRCFEDLKIGGLEKFNIIGGKNNVGKTAVLEGLFLCAGPTKPELTLKLNAFRGLEVFETGKDIWSNIFFNKDIENKIEMEYKDEKHFSRSTKISLEPQKTIKISKDRQRNAEAKGDLFETENIEDYELRYYYQDDDENTFKIKGRLEKGQIKFDVQPIKNPFEAIFINARYRSSPIEEANRYSKIKIKRGEENILKALKAIDSRIRELTIIAKGGYSSLYYDIGLKEMMPMQTIGEGTVKYLSMLLAIANARDGIVMIDELENGIHYAVLEKVIRNLYNFSNIYNVQIFATTHSFECVRTAYNVFSEFQDSPFKYFRLDNIKENIIVTEYDRDTLEAAFEMNLEVR